MTIVAQRADSPEPCMRCGEPTLTVIDGVRTHRGCRAVHCKITLACALRPDPDCDHVWRGGSGELTICDLCGGCADPSPAASSTEEATDGR